ncbi:Response regulator receiver domain-containing protein [Thiothrix caldifontis]|uniref:Sensory/regulatory protein RpfC n=2 Tax=Thiothrix caldifontis TaxID=525918 RepID=A0A1H3VH38_9GAMM|nr:Response regulator receiver domain-containing protein [Thiothrix caldifontis]
MHVFTNLKLMQIIDSAFLVALLSIIAMLLWLNLTKVSTDVQHNMQVSNTSLQQSHAAFVQQLALENAIDQQRTTFDTLNDEFFKFAFDPNSTPDNLPLLHTLSQTLQQQGQALLAIWPIADRPDLKNDYEEAMGIMSNLSVELEGLPPAHWRQLAIDARDTANQAKLLMAEIEKIDNELGKQIGDTILQSIQNTDASAAQMAEQLAHLKQRALWGTLIIITLLIMSRLYFSTRFQHMTQMARNAQQVAEEALKTKARFLATMSHEIRTPMNGVIGMTRLLMNTPMSKKQTEFVDSIHLSGEHLLTVINDVLDFSKIEAGKLDLKREPFELRACIEEILNLLNAKALEKHLELAYAVGPSIPLFIEGDMVRLRQILTNLIGNAIKFTDRGEITIFVIPRCQKGEDYELEFQINDTGPGIPTERLESIFEQFSRADDNLARRHEGTGLGLTISRHLVEMMGGTIWAESAVGVGSRFHFTIKTRKAVGKLKPFLHSNIPEIVGKRILLVENNPASSQAMQDFCIGWGAVVDTASTSSDAISRIAVGKPYDIALVDSNLPGDSPLELAKYIRQRFSKQELPLILIAPPNDRHSKETVRELYNLYLTKPITRSRLFDSLMTVLGELNLISSRPEQSTLKLGERLPLSILLAEDNPINQIVASSILDEMSYKTDVAESGLQVLQALHKKAYDVIFMDMQMPDMDGLEATRRIRADFPPNQQPIIIAMTANAMEGDRQECLNAGMNDYISKPVLPEAVEMALQRWCITNSQPQPRKEPDYVTTSA